MQTPNSAICSRDTRRLFTAYFSIASVILALSADRLSAQGASPASRSSHTDSAKPAEEAVTLSPFEVTTTVEHDYSASESTTGTRVKSSINELPFAVSVVTNEFMNDFRAVSLEEQFGYTSSFASQGDVEGGYLMRGFLNNISLRNGFQRPGLTDRFNIDRAEVIKGPAASIYGQVQPGGIVNLVSKKPTPTAQQSVAIEGGSLDYRRATVSSSGPLPGNTFSYRLDGAYYNQDDGIGYRGFSHWTVSGVLRAKLSPQTTVTVEFDWLARKQGRGERLPFAQDVSTGLPTRTTGLAWQFWGSSIQGPNEFNNRGVKNIEGYLEHRFSPALQWRLSAARYLRYYDQFSTVTTPAVATSGTNLAVRNLVTGLEPGVAQIPYNGTQVQSDLLTEFKTGTVGHKLLLTFDYSFTNRQQYNYRSNRAMTTAQQAAVAQKYGFPVVGPDLRLSPAFNTLNFNMLAPDYTSLLPEHYTVVQDRTTGSGVLGAYSQNLFDVYGVFLSERFSALDGRLIGMAGVRWDYVKSNLYSESAAVSNNAVTAARSLANVDSFTYQAGLNYKVAPSTVLYANASTSFIPQTVFNTIDPKTGDPLPNPSVFDNERGVGSEAGVKVSALSGRISFTADVFDVERQNVVASETGTRPTGGTFTYNALNGRIESRGFELDANIRPTRDVQVILGYGRVDAEIKRASNRVTEGLPPAQVPRDNFGAAVAWRQNGGGGPSGWFANLGYRMQSKSRPSDAAGRELIYQPLFEIWDVGFGYRWKAGNVHYRAQANIKNLLDERYVRGAAYPGEPRRWIFGLSAVF